MSNSVFTSMKEQMTPSVEARAALTVKLAQAAPAPKTIYWGRYVAVAACAALLIAAYPAYQSFVPKEPKLHDYTVVEGSGEETVKTMAGVVEGTVDEGEGGGQNEEVAVNTGDLTGDPVPGIPTQPGADVYQLLMAHFGETRPDWYGGAYVEKNGTLMVLLVSDRDPGDKSLELEVLEAVGRNAPVAFTGAKYSRNDLERVNREIGKLLDGKGIYASWGIYDDQNCIILDFQGIPSEEILTGLARLDPDGDAILVRIVEGSTTVTDEIVKGPPPIDTIGEEDSGIDVVHQIPGGAYVSDEGEDLEAIEPYDDEGKIADLQTKEPAIEEPAVEEPATEEAQPARTENAD